MHAETKLASFISAVWEEWKVLVSGGAGIVLLLSLAERASGKNISWSWYVALLALLVVWACYVAWKKERQGLSRLQRELEKHHSPRLKGIIRQASVGKLAERTDAAVITIIASIRNLGMPSIATGWSLLVKVPDKGLLHGTLQHTTGRLLMGQKGHPPVIHQNVDFLYNKLSEQPLLTGGEVTGLLVFQLDGVSKEDVFRAGTVLVLAFEDVTERACFVADELFGEESMPKFFPGMKSVAYQPQTEKRDNYDLILQVDTTAADAVKLRRQPRLLGAGITADAYIIIANFKIRFINQSLDPLSVTGVKALLIKVDESGGEKEIPLDRDSSSSLTGGGQPVDLENFYIPGIKMTPYYDFECLLIALVNYVGELNENCFLRITIGAMRQPPYSVDLDVADWEMAGGGGSSIRPRT